MGAPEGHPYAHPEGVCINGLGALPSPYGPTLRGAHNGPSGLQKIKINYRAEGHPKLESQNWQFWPQNSLTRRKHAATCGTTTK